MKYHVYGVGRQTGEERELTVEAAGADAAGRAGEQSGIVVWAVEPAMPIRSRMSAAASGEHHGRPLAVMLSLVILAGIGIVALLTAPRRSGTQSATPLQGQSVAHSDLAPDHPDPAKLIPQLPIKDAASNPPDPAAQPAS